MLARTLGVKMNQDWSQAVVVDNRAGAAGIIGADLVAKSAPDGYTLLMAQVGDTISMSLYSKLPSQLKRDFAPITLVGFTPFILVVHPALPAKNVQELIALAKAKPGGLTFASGGTGVASHLAGELFKSTAGIESCTCRTRAGAGDRRFARRPGLVHVQQSDHVAAAREGRQNASAGG